MSLPLTTSRFWTSFSYGRGQFWSNLDMAAAATAREVCRHEDKGVMEKEEEGVPRKSTWKEIIEYSSTYVLHRYLSHSKQKA